MEEKRIKIVRVDQAGFFITDLFKKSFGDLPPATPVHYIAFYKSSPSTFEAIGYYHVDYRGKYALVGGLCVDRQFYRKLWSGRRPILLGKHRGVAEKLVRAALEDAEEHKAFFAYTGNPLSQAIIHRVGFVETRHKYLMVKWLKSLPEEEKEKIITEVVAIGPF